LSRPFESLTPDQRAVLALHYSMGFSIADTADALGIRIGTAKSRLSAGTPLCGANWKTRIATSGRRS
jgi:DNA-directed RNA polymerase specialized sigma24 family protein